MIPSAIKPAKRWNWSAITLITKSTATRWVTNAYRSVTIMESSFSPWMWLFTHPEKRPNTNLRKIDKRTCGWKRRQEALKKKTNMLTQMLQNAYNSGIDAACVLFDSWFSYDSIINKVVTTGYNVVCRLKNGNVKYQYQGKGLHPERALEAVCKKTAAMDNRLSDQRLLSDCQSARNRRGETAVHIRRP